MVDSLCDMDVHLVDGTYELFRNFFAVPSRKTDDGREIGAIRGVLTSMMLLLENGATHVAVATDHVFKSFRNDLWDGYKDGSDIDPAIAEQFEPLEEALTAMGLCVWPMTEFEADDALAAGAALAAADKRVERVLICTPDKDLAQCVGASGAITVGGEKVFQLDRRKERLFDANECQEKFGVMPESIPDYLALVGDAADGFPGLPGWGAKSAATVLSRYVKLDKIPDSPTDWDIEVRAREKLANTLSQNRELALLFRKIATVRTDAPVSKSVNELRWLGPQKNFAAICAQMGADALPERAKTLSIKNTARK